MLLLGQPQIGESYGIKIVVSERDEAKSEPAQLDDFLNHHIGAALTRTLAVSSPYRTERTVLGTTADSLNRGPHITFPRHQIPSCR